MATTDNVVRYVDSDYAGDLDRRRYLLGYIFTLYNNAISWKATLQSIVPLSTTEAEYISATKGVKEATWLWGLVNELGLTQKILIVFYDSQSVIHLTKNNHYHNKTKHINIKHHFIRDVEKLWLKRFTLLRNYGWTLFRLGWLIQYLNAFWGYIGRWTLVEFEPRWRLLEYVVLIQFLIPHIT